MEKQGRLHTRRAAETVYSQEARSSLGSYEQVLGMFYDAYSSGQLNLIVVLRHYITHLEIYN